MHKVWSNEAVQVLENIEEDRQLADAMKKAKDIYTVPRVGRVPRSLARVEAPRWLHFATTEGGAAPGFCDFGADMTRILNGSVSNPAGES